jgi:hypothetical protein
VRVLSVIPGIEGANGLVGPSLSQVGDRVYIAGVLRNTPDNMVVWLRLQRLNGETAALVQGERS